MKDQRVSGGACVASIATTFVADLELFNQATELRGHLGQLMRGFHRVVRTGRRALCGLRHAGNILSNLGGTLCRLGNVSRHFIGCRALFLDCGGDGA
jgi:hypothetical protein